MRKINKETVNLETLFQLKRDETPNEAFWDAFNQQLQTKLVSARLKRPFLERALRAHVFSFKWLHWVPVAACLCLFFTHYQLSKSGKMGPPRFVFIPSTIGLQSIKSLPLMVDSQEVFVPSKSPISIPQKTLAKIGHKRFSF